MRHFIISTALTCVALLSPARGLLAQTYPVGDLIFCLDASGSMTFNLPGTSDTRWACAKQAFQQLMLDIDNIVANYTDAAGNNQRPEGGWVGIIQFPGKIPSAAGWTDIFVASTEIPVAIPAKENFFDPIIHDRIDDPFDPFTPRMGIPGTPIGQGLIKSKEQFQVFGGARAPIPNHAPGTRAIILLTDGENNQLPELTSAWSASFNHAGGVAQNLLVYAIGFGNPADLGTSTHELYTVTSNVSFTPPGGVTQTGAVYFLDPGILIDGGTGAPGARATPFLLAKEMRDLVFEGALGFLELEDVVDPTFVLKSGESRNFDLCAGAFDSTLIISLSVADFERTRLPEVSIQVPGDLTITPANAGTFNQIRYSAKNGTQYFNFGYGFLTARHGDWKVRITAVDSGLYNFGAYGRSGLGFEIRHTLATPQTGDRVPFEMRFNFGAVTEDSLLVQLNKEEPTLGLGNLFAEQLLTPSQMDTVFSFRNNVDFTPAGAKYRYLNAENRVSAPNLGNRTVVFNDQGKDGDRVAGDGIFTWRTEPLVKPEVHKFVFEVKGKTSVTGDVFCRSKTIHFPVQVKVVPDWNVSQIKFMSVEANSGKVLIQPRDLSGNILAPHFAKDFDVQISGGTLNGVLQNDLEGYYVQNISYQPESQPVIHVKYLDQVFPPFPIPSKRKGNWVAMSLHYGQLFPVGNLGKSYKDGAISLMADLEYRFAQSPWSVNVFVGHTQLKSDSVGVADDDLVSITLAGRYHFARNHTLVPFVEIGPGYYFFTNAEDQYGVKAGAGVKVKVSRKLAWEAGGAYHWLSKNDFRYVQAQAGLIYRF